MQKSIIYQYLNFEDYNATPKYLQLANAIIKGISKGEINKDEFLPGINELSFEKGISLDTSENAYTYLKKLGIVGSVAGKGYFINCTEIEQHLKIFLLFNKLSFHKKIIYDAFVKALGNNALVDFYIYNNDFALFKRMIHNRKDDYTHFVVIPHYTDGEDNTIEVLKELPAEKLIILDKMVPDFTGDFGAVYEQFDKDLLEALEEALPHLAKYHTINIIFPEDTYYPREIIKALNIFCSRYTFNYNVIHDITKVDIEPGNMYINLMECDLVVLIEKIIEKNLHVGVDVGVISYNETPLKRIILDGITTISTDFEMMGQTAARLVMEYSREKVKNPFKLTLRNSL